MTERWVIALVVIAAGFAVGATVGWLVRRRLRAARGGELTSSIAGAAGLLVFWFLALTGLLIAIGLVRPETLEDIPRQVLDYTPRLLAAGLIMLAGWALALGASRLVAFGMERASRKTVLRATRGVRWAVFAAAVILALAQLGVDTTILVIIVAVSAGGFALGLALLVGLGGKELAGEIAAGRYLSRFLGVGMTIETADDEGEVVALHPATAELATPDGRRRHVPYSRLLEGGLTLGPQATSEERTD